MRVLMLGTDRKIFEEGSEVRHRMTEYASLTDELWILVLGQGTFAEEKIGNLRLLTRSRLSALFWASGEKFDLISAQDPFETGFIGWRIARRLGAKLQLQIHTDFLSPYFGHESLKNKIRVLLARFLLPRADGIRVVSNKIKNSLVSRFPLLAPRIIVLPIFVDTEKLRQAPTKTDLRKKYPQFSKIILLASRLTREKNIGLVVAAMREVARRFPRAGLIIVGAGPEERSLKLKVESSKLSRNVLFEPWTSDLASYYKTADLFLLVSFYEGYGRTLVEAAACDLPVISTDVGIAREILPPENIISPNDPKLLAEKIVLAVEGKLPPTNFLVFGTKEKYLLKYRESWGGCFK